MRISFNTKFDAKDINVWRSATTGFKGFISEGKDFIPNEEGYAQLDGLAKTYGDFYKKGNLQEVLDMLPMDVLVQIKGNEIVLNIPLTEDVDMVYTFLFEFAEDFSCILM